MIYSILLNINNGVIDKEEIFSLVFKYGFVLIGAIIYFSFWYYYKKKEEQEENGIIKGKITNILENVDGDYYELTFEYLREGQYITDKVNSLAFYEIGEEIGIKIDVDGVISIVDLHSLKVRKGLPVLEKHQIFFIVGILIFSSILYVFVDILNLLNIKVEKEDIGFFAFVVALLSLCVYLIIKIRDSYKKLNEIKSGFYEKLETTIIKLVIVDVFYRNGTKYDSYPIVEYEENGVTKRKKINTLISKDTILSEDKKYIVYKNKYTDEFITEKEFILIELKPKILLGIIIFILFIIILMFLSSF